MCLNRALPLLVVLLAWAFQGSLATPAAARQQFTQLMYCNYMSGGCYLAWFYAEQVEVVASYGQLDIFQDGNWGYAGCPDCMRMIEEPPPHPEPVAGPEGCGDERDNIIEEYRGGQVAWTPGCGDFASGGGAPHFSWSELNGGFTNGNPHTPWGIVTSGLTNGLETTRTNYARGGIRLSSGYRCPHGNANVGGVQQSLHMHGRAGDMFSSEHSWTEAEFTLLKEAADLTGPVESLHWHTYTDRHFHAAW